MERLITRRSVGLASWRVVTEASGFGWNSVVRRAACVIHEKTELFGGMTVQDIVLLGTPQSIAMCHSRAPEERLLCFQMMRVLAVRRRATPKS